MLEIDVVLEDFYDETTERFVPSKSETVRLEHSLVSVSKWEAVWEQAFLGSKEKTTDQTVSYIKMMIVGAEPPPGVFQKLLEKHIEQVKEYVGAAMSATKLSTDKNAPSSKEIVTSELIYYWMISLNVPVEFEHWHLNRLITLIRVINLKNTPKKKMSNSERRALNRQRLAKHNTRG
jgi:hypothetical protein